jgi:hypothetical protein
VENAGGSPMKAVTAGQALRFQGIEHLGRP